MAIGRVNTGGGGGAGLNFKVVGGTTQPASPAENTIWVNTDTAITDWVFSPAQPTAAAGRVWINTGVASNVPANALKKNGIWVYPTGCSQYISGAWAVKNAKTYQNGAWIDWRMYLYTVGDVHSALTGGWARAHRNSSSTDPEDSMTAQGASTLSKVLYVTSQKIDIANFTLLTAKFSKTTNLYTQYSGEYGYAVGLRSISDIANLGGNILKPSRVFDIGYAHKETGDVEGYELTVDLSGIEGKYNIGVWFGCCNCSCYAIKLS